MARSFEAPGILGRRHVNLLKTLFTMNSAKTERVYKSKNIGCAYTLRQAEGMDLTKEGDAVRIGESRLHPAKSCKFVSFNIHFHDPRTRQGFLLRQPVVFGGLHNFRGSISFGKLCCPHNGFETSQHHLFLVPSFPQSHI